MTNKTVTIGDLFFVTDFVANGSFASLKENVKYLNKPDYAILVRLTDNTKNWNGNYVYVNQKSYDFLAKSKVIPGDLIISNVGEPGIAFIVPDLKQPMTLGPNSILLRPLNSSIITEYIYYLIKSPEGQRKISKIVSTTTIRKFNKTNFKNIELPLPPLSDQLHITHILSKAENLIAQRKESICLLDEFLKSMFLEMFGDPVSNEKGFRKSRLSTLTKIGTGGTPSRKMDIEYYQGIIPWVKTAEINGGYIFNTDEKITEAALRKSNCKIYPVGTILLAMYGQGKTRGNVGFLKIEATTNQACAAILPFNELNSMFLFEQLKQMYYHIRSMAKGSNQENLNLSIVGNICVIIPPLKLQTQFADIVEKTEALKAQYQQSLQELENLYGSLSQRAFKGELSYELKKTETS